MLPDPKLRAIARARALRQELFTRYSLAFLKFTWRLTSGTVRLIFRRCLAAAQAVAITVRRRRALAELQRLDERTLKDIGLTRGDLPLVAESYARGFRYTPESAPSVERGELDRASPTIQRRNAEMDGSPARLRAPTSQ